MSTRESLEALREALARVELMASGDPQWDLSNNDRRALKITLQALAASCNETPSNGGICAPIVSSSEDKGQEKGLCDHCKKPVTVRMGEAWHTKGDKVWHELCSYQQQIEQCEKRITELEQAAQPAPQSVPTVTCPSCGVRFSHE